jgi:eukaryotic-like serine/threonine-protein kinase
MSPEQAMGRSDVDQRTDVFALGAILYEMLTDKVAFDAPNIAKILLRIMNDNPQPPSQLMPSCPPALDRVVQKALRKEKEERYGSAAEFAAAVIAGFGLSGTAEQWAHKSEADVASAIAAAAPQPARKPAAPAPAPAAAPAATAEVAAPAPAVARSAEASRDRGEPTLPKIDLTSDDGVAARAVPSGPNLGTMALVAVALAAIAGVLTLLLR